MTLPDRSLDVSPSLPPDVPRPSVRLPLIPMWSVPFILVVLYVVLVVTFFHDQARWTGRKLEEVTFLLLVVTLAFSFLWFVLAWGVAILLGELVPLGVLVLLTKLPGINRHVVVTPAARPDSAREVWGRFGILLLILLGFELILMITVVRRGELSPSLVLGEPFVFFRDEVLAGTLLAILLAPVGAFVGSRLRTRITDSLEFPLLWLALLLLVVGGVSVLTLEVLPGAVVSPGEFLTSVLFYAPAAWFIALAFSRTEWRVQTGFVRRAWKNRSARFHFGKILIRDDPQGVITEL